MCFFIAGEGAITTLGGRLSPQRALWRQDESALAMGGGGPFGGVACTLVVVRLFAGDRVGLKKVTDKIRP